MFALLQELHGILRRLCHAGLCLRLRPWGAALATGTAAGGRNGNLWRRVQVWTDADGLKTKQKGREKQKPKSGKISQQFRTNIRTNMATQQRNQLLLN
jgi:hypothetical protein